MISLVVLGARTSYLMESHKTSGGVLPAFLTRWVVRIIPMALRQISVLNSTSVSFGKLLEQAGLLRPIISFVIEDGYRSVPRCK